MNIKTWFKHTSRHERELVARDAETTLAYLDQLAGGHRHPSPALARRLEQASLLHTPNHILRREHLRPDIWEHVA